MHGGAETICCEQVLRLAVVERASAQRFGNAGIVIPIIAPFPDVPAQVEQPLRVWLEAACRRSVSESVRLQFGSVITIAVARRPGASAGPDHGGLQAVFGCSPALGAEANGDAPLAIGRETIALLIS